MNDILDLDALLPPDRQVKINKKLYTVKPLTIAQLITVTKLNTRLSQVKSEDEIYPLIKEGLSPFIPEFAQDDNILNVTVEQLKALLEFVQRVSTPDEADTTKQYSDPKKKVSSPEESHTS